MKAVYLAITVLFFHSCSKPMEKKLLGAQQTEPEPLSILASSNDHPSGTVTVAAARISRSGLQVPAETALRCLSKERFRQNALDACLLAWATNGEESSALEEQLRQLLIHMPSTNTALAMVKKKGFVEKLNLGELIILESALHKAPAWSRALAAKAWLERNSPKSRAESDSIWAALRWNESPDHPLNLGIMFHLATRLERGTEFGQIYCPAESSLSGTRCLRFISAVLFANTETKDSVKDYYERFRYSLGEFERFFPERAAQIKNAF